MDLYSLVGGGKRDGGEGFNKMAHWLKKLQQNPRIETSLT